MKELLERKKGLRRSILIVDDDHIAREILGRMLEDRYEVSCAENGVIALSIIKRDKLKLSLVILDLHMELLKRLGCNIIQGYYFSKPLPPEKFGILIEKELREKKDAYN